MNKGVWKGKHAKPVLILAESHYSSVDKIGQPVDYPTSNVIEEYLEGQQLKTKLFTKIAKCFGYSRSTATNLYNQIYFGNYIDRFCYIGKSNPAKQIVAENRMRFNDELVSFVNANNIEVIVCVSRLVFDNLPSEADSDTWITDSSGLIDIYSYSPSVSRNNCSIPFDRRILIYGLPHLSARKTVLSYNEIKSELSKDPLLHTLIST